MHQPNKNPEHAKTAEAEPQPPRIYAASLGDYNAGRLHGNWLDADADPEELADGITTMLARSPTANAEEWAIHDYEGFGPLRLGEYEDLETISQIGQGIAEHGAAFAHWAATCGTHDRDELGRFEDVYRGHWPSVDAYAEELLDDLGINDLLDKHIGEPLRSYLTVDAAAFARDLQYSGDITASQGDQGVYLFDNLA